MLAMGFIVAFSPPVFRLLPSVGKTIIPSSENPELEIVTNVQETEDEAPDNDGDFVAPVPPLEAELPFVFISVVYLQVQGRLTNFATSY